MFKLHLVLYSDCDHEGSSQQMFKLHLVLYSDCDMKGVVTRCSNSILFSIVTVT